MTWIHEVFIEIEKTVWQQVKITLWWSCRAWPKQSMNLSADLTHWIQARCSPCSGIAVGHTRSGTAQDGVGEDTITTLLKNIKAQMAENPSLTQNPWFSALFGEACRGQHSKCTATTPLSHQDQCGMTLSQTQQAGPGRTGPSTVYPQSFTPSVLSGCEQPPQLFLQSPHITHPPPYHKRFYPPMTSHLSPPYKHPTHIPQPPYIFNASSTYSYTQPNSHSFNTAHWYLASHYFLV